MYNGCPAVGSYVLSITCIRITVHLGIEKKNFFKGGGQPLLLIHEILYQNIPYFLRGQSYVLVHMGISILFLKR